MAHGVVAPPTLLCRADSAEDSADGWPGDGGSGVSGSGSDCGACDGDDLGGAAASDGLAASSGGDGGRNNGNGGGGGGGDCGKGM